MIEQGARFDRTNTTLPVRVMLPLVPILSLFTAGFLLFDKESNYERAESWTLLLSWLPVRQWGVVWATLGVLQLLAWLSGRRMPMVVMVFAGATAWMGWSLIFLVTALNVAGALLSGVGAYFFISLSHFATAASLTVENVLPYGKKVR